MESDLKQIRTLSKRKKKENWEFRSFLKEENRGCP